MLPFSSASDRRSFSLDGESAERFIRHDRVAQYAALKEFVRVGYPGNVRPAQLLVAADSKVHDLHTAGRPRVDDNQRRRVDQEDGVLHLLNQRSLVFGSLGVGDGGEPLFDLLTTFGSYEL